MEVDLRNVLATASKYKESLALELKPEQTRKKPKDQEDADSGGIVVQNIGRYYTYLGQFEKAEQRLSSALHGFINARN